MVILAKQGKASKSLGNPSPKQRSLFLQDQNSKPHYVEIEERTVQTHSLFIISFSERERERVKSGVENESPNRSE